MLFYYVRLGNIYLWRTNAICINILRFSRNKSEKTHKERLTNLVFLLKGL